MIMQTAPGIGDDEVTAFVEARANTDRQAFNRYLSVHRVPPDEPLAKQAARLNFDRLPLLLAPSLTRLSLAALTPALGPMATTISITVWPSLYRTLEGTPMTMTWANFGHWHHRLAAQVAPKGEGLVYSPITTRTGGRTNANTTAIHALTLDCDGLGEWFCLWRVLMDLDFAALAHRSGGFSPGVPKWRIILPLSVPFSTCTPTQVECWRATYATCRTVFGALAQLSGPGFDAATDLACNAWFPGFRRSVDAPPREVVIRPGATLDIAALLFLLPQTQRRLPGVRVVTWPTTAPSLLELAFDEAGMLGNELGRDQTPVICPWNDCHSEPLQDGVEPSSASVLFPPNTSANIGGFWCAHNSCGFKRPGEVLAMLPADAVQRARLLHQRSPGRHRYTRGLDWRPDYSLAAQFRSGLR